MYVGIPPRGEKEEDEGTKTNSPQSSKYPTRLEKAAAIEKSNVLRFSVEFERRGVVVELVGVTGTYPSSH